MAKKKKVFLSWSGCLSKNIASACKDFLEEIFGENSTFVSFRDIPMGANWAKKLSEELEKDNCGIIFLTPENIEAPWLFFEAGALSAKKDANVVPVFFGVERNNFQDNPLFLQQSVVMTRSKLLNVKTNKKEDLHIILKMVNDKLGKPISKKAMNKKLNNKWEAFRKTLNNIGKEYIPKTKINGINYKTMRCLLETCEKYNEAIFFDIQMDVDEWFNPNMQIHLAMQDSVSKFEQLSELSRKIDLNCEKKIFSKRDIPKLYNYFGTPSSRIMFIPIDEDSLKKEVNDTASPYYQLVEFAVIHLLMSTPLAIITLDRFVDIIRDEKNHHFFGRADFCKALNLPHEIIDSEKISFEEACDDLKDALMKMKIQAGKIKPSIDFAAFYNKSGKVKDIWGGSVERDFQVVYYPITDDIVSKTKRKNIFTYNLKKRNIHIELNLIAQKFENDFPRILKRFSKIITTTVFESVASYNKFKRRIKVSQTVDQLLNTTDPVVKAFKKRRLWHGKKIIRHVKPIYCPLHFLRNARAQNLIDLSGKKYK